MLIDLIMNKNITWKQYTPVSCLGWKVLHFVLEQRMPKDRRALIWNPLFQCMVDYEFY